MYPTRTNRNFWTKTFYKEHICSDVCNTEYEIEDNFTRITYQSGCLFPEKIEPLVVHVSDYSHHTYIDEEIPIPRNIKIKIDYPLNNPLTIEHEFKEDKITLSVVLNYFDQLYKKIYSEEEENLEKKEWDITKKCDKCSDDLYKEENLINYLESQDSIENENCSICFDELTPDNTFKIKNCPHFFHKECVIRWFNTPKVINNTVTTILEEPEEKKSNSCPVCRTPIILCKTCNSKQKIEEKFLGVVPPFDIDNIEIPDRPETNGPYKIHTLYYEELFFKGFLYEREKNILKLLPFENIQN